jgi:hypothetical protein
MGGGSATGGGSVDSGTPDAGPVLFYAATNTNLYQLDIKTTSMPSLVGTFDCIGIGANQDSAMTDLAVDSSGQLWGISSKHFYSLVVQGSTVHCATSTALTGTTTFYGLTLVPAGILDPNQEVLLAADSAGELWSISSTGTLTMHGTLGNVPANDGQGHTYASANVGKAFELSGDLVVLSNGGSPVGYATVRDCPNPPTTTGCNTTDTLVELDLTALQTATTNSVVKAIRGQLVKAASCGDAVTGYGSTYGITAGNGHVYGFQHAGGIIEVDATNGASCTVQSTTQQWGGAGTSTSTPP